MPPEMYLDCVTFCGTIPKRCARGDVTAECNEVRIKVANLDKFWSSDSQWSDAPLNSEFHTAWDVCCLWRYQGSFDPITIIMLISIQTTSATIISDRRANSIWQFLLIFTVKERATQTFIVKLIAEHAHSFLFPLHQRCFQNRRENIIYFEATVQSLSFLHDTKTRQSSSGFVGFGCI